MRKVSRYNRSVATYRLSAVVLLSTIQGLGSAALAQNQGIGGVSQLFGEDPGQAGDYPSYRIEVLAFAYNGFDPNEEIFPEEPFQIRLDTRPPKFLIVPPPPASDDSAPAAMIAEASPETELASDSAPAVDSPVDTGGPMDTDGPVDPGGLVNIGDPEDVDLLGDFGGLEGETIAEPDPIDELLGPADDASLDSSLEASLHADISVWPEAPWVPIRSAYVQRLIASLKFLEDPSRVPMVFDAIPESPLLTGPDDLDPDPLESDAVDPGTVDIEEPGLSLQTPRTTFRVLRADELELRGARQRLGRDDEYTPLAHGGWILPAYPPDQAIPIDISLLGTVNPVGTVQLHLSRFLHVTVDLVYRAPPVPGHMQAATLDTGRLSELELPPRYALRTQRRVRSGEVNYLDHPAIGILVVVRPQPVEPGDVDDPSSPPRGPAA